MNKDEMLRDVFCAANRHELHKHKCESKTCGAVWEHTNECAGDEDAHTCPKCHTELPTAGEGGWPIYFGDEPINIGQVRHCQAPEYFNIIEQVIPPRVLELAREVYRRKHKKAA